MVVRGRSISNVVGTQNNLSPLAVAISTTIEAPPMWQHTSLSPIATNYSVAAFNQNNTSSISLFSIHIFNVLSLYPIS